MSTGKRDLHPGPADLGWTLYEPLVAVSILLERTLQVDGLHLYTEEAQAIVADAQDAAAHLDRIIALLRPLYDAARKEVERPLTG